MTDFPQSHYLPISRIAQRDVLTALPGMPVAQALQLMEARQVGCVIICEHERPQGIFTRRDLMRIIAEQTPDLSQPLSAVMSSPVKTVDMHESADEVGLRFVSESFRHLVVVKEDGCVWGVVSETDLVHSQGPEHDLFLKSVGSLANTAPLIVPGTLEVSRVLERMRLAKQAAALIDHQGQVSNIVTERDITALVLNEQLHSPVAEVVHNKLASVPGETSLYNARKLFRSYGYRHLAVTENDRVVGLISFSDILRSVEQDYIYRLRELLNQRDRALEKSEHNLRLADQVINASMEAILVTDARGHIIRTNPAFTEITGYQAWEVMGHNPNILSSGRHDQSFYQNLWQELLRDGHWQGEIWNRRKNGDIYPEWLSITAVHDDEGHVTQYAAIFSDLTEVKRSEARLRRLALFDHLTHLPNRKLFHDRLQQALAYAHEHSHKVAVVTVNLDLFKQINDRFGHASGDQVLRTLAKRIEAALEQGDTVARLGGDEFIMILTDVDASSDLSGYIQRLMREIYAPQRVKGHEVNISCSIGVSVYPDDAADCEGMVRTADSALTQAKSSGRNNFRFFSPQLDQEVQSRYRLSNLLQSALRKKEFYLHYQPKINLQDGSLVGVEALIRWHNDEVGFVSPADFIPLAEDIGLIDAIGGWVFEESAEQAKLWCIQALETQVAVNVSARQMQRGGMADQIATVLKNHRLDAHQLAIELTETSFLHSLDETQYTIDALHEQGVEVAIDDFGTGYSSLGYLRAMNTDLLKIDRSFIEDIETSASACQIVSAIISMGHALGQQVIAEGVETQGQLDLLRQMGCDQAQGYFIARPMLPADLQPWLQAWHTRMTELLPIDEAL